MINYNYDNEDDLTYLSSEEKLKIVRIEVEKIISINSLLIDALRYSRGELNTDGYLIASRIIDKASWNIIKMFP